MHKINSVIKIVYLFCVLFYVKDSFLFAQVDRKETNREIVIGELAGRTDIRELKILTKQGSLPVSGEGNGKPFSILSLSPRQAVIQFYRSSELNEFNPNGVKVKLFDTERALISALILDEVDVALLENEASAIEVRKSNQHFLPLPIPMELNTVKLIMYNHKHPFLQSKKIRQALAYGIDHHYIIDKIILGGKASIAKGPFDENSQHFSPGMQSYRYNPRFALNMLIEEGFTDFNKDGVLESEGNPFIVNLYYQKGLSIDEQISRIVKINLIKLGIDIQPRPLTKTEINDKLASGDFEAVLLDHTFSDNVLSLDEFFAVNGAKNYMNYRSDKFGKYLRFYQNAKDPNSRKTLIQSLQSVVNEDQPVTFLYFKWLTHFMINVDKFENFRYTEGNKRGQIRPFEEWIIKDMYGR